MYVSFSAAAKSLQSCPTLCNPIDGSPPGSTVPGILQARTLERVAISFCNVWKWKVKVKSPSHVRLFATPWTAAYQALLSMGFSRQEYWSGVLLPSPISFSRIPLFNQHLSRCTWIARNFFKILCFILKCTWNLHPILWQILTLLTKYFQFFWTHSRIALSCRSLKISGAP